MYYLRTKPAANALQFTVDKSKLKNANSVANGTKQDLNGTSDTLEEDEDPVLVCSRENGDACMMCSA